MMNGLCSVPGIQERRIAHKEEFTSDSVAIWQYKKTFAPLKIQPELMDIDLEKKKATGIVKYHDKIYLSVMVNLQNNKMRVKGNLRGIKKLCKPFKKKNYIEISKSEAEFLIENGITKPK